MTQQVGVSTVDEGDAGTARTVARVEDGATLGRLGCDPLPASLPLPVLERLLDKLPAGLMHRLKDSWGVTVRIGRGPLRRERLSRLAEAFDAQTLVGSFGPVTAAETGVLAFERSTVRILLELALGGRPQTAAATAMDRALTATEVALMRPAAGFVLDALTASLRQAGEAALPFLRWRRDIDALRLRRPGDSCIAFDLTIDFGFAQGAVLVALPLALLDPLRPALETVYPGDAALSEQRWRARLAAELSRAPVSLAAVLHEMDVPLARLKALKIGDTLALEITADPEVALMAGDVRVAVGRLGRSGPFAAVRLDGIAETRKGIRP